VAVEGEKARSGLAPRQLVVVADAVDTACTLSQPETGTLDPAPYSTACINDADCRLGTVGNLCAPCLCPNYALAKTAGPAFDADYRARSSQCATPNDQAVCAGCALVTPKCDKSGPVGKCKAVN
jgi:hypothetical protein